MSFYFCSSGWRWKVAWGSRWSIERWRRSKKWIAYNAWYRKIFICDMLPWRCIFVRANTNRWNERQRLFAGNGKTAFELSDFSRVHQNQGNFLYDTISIFYAYRFMWNSKSKTVQVHTVLFTDIWGYINGYSWISLIIITG